MNSTHIQNGANISLNRWTLAIIIGLIVEGLFPIQFIPIEFFSAHTLALVYTYLPEPIIGFLTQSYMDYIYFPVSAIRNGAATGICIGFAQWYVLRHVVNWAKQWIVASMVGGIISSLILMGINLLISPWSRSILTNYSMQGILLGVALGIAQWWVLRQYVRLASSWILANIVSWLVGAVVGLIVGTSAAFIIGSMLGIFLSWLTGTEEAFGYGFYFVGYLTSLMIGGTIGGVITGKTLVWLLGRPRVVNVNSKVTVS